MIRSSSRPRQRSGADDALTPQSIRLASRLSRLAAPIAIIGLFLLILVGQSQLAFRDVSHFYTPLYDYVARRCAHDALPLWNPLDQTGLPLLGETSTALFYPLRYLIYFMPLSPESAMGCYVLFHLVIASVTARTMARICGASIAAANLVGTIYPLSGGVLFLYTNPPFLVSAAWLPLALASVLARRPIDVLNRFMLLAVALALMILGGDPQTALHAGLVTGTILAIDWFRSRTSHRAKRWTPLATLAAGSCFAIVLSLPQVCASVSWSEHSQRVHHDQPHRVWKAPPQSSQQHEAFSFSLPPWHIAELVTPNAYGELFPQYRRVSSLLANDGRVWTPSIYGGMFALVALLATMRRRSIDRWTGIFWASLFLAMGSFGLMSVMHGFTNRLDDLDPAVGGPYWLLYHFLPGYDVFRYPTKWLPFVMLSLAMIAGRWLDRSLTRKTIWSMKWVASLAALLLAAIIFVTWLQWYWTPTTIPVDRYWGPLQVTQGLAQVRTSLLHSLVVLGVFFVLGLALRRTKHGTLDRSQQSAYQHIYAAAIVLITATELTIAGRSLVMTTDKRLVSASVDAIRPTTRLERDTEDRWLRTQRGKGSPTLWRTTASDQRPTEVDISQRASWFGRWHLGDDQAVFNSSTSIQSKAFVEFWMALSNTNRDASIEDQRQLWRAVRRWLNLNATVTVDDAHVDATFGDATYSVAKISHQRTDPAFKDALEWHANWTWCETTSQTQSELAAILSRLAKNRSPDIPNVYYSTKDRDLADADSPSDSEPMNDNEVILRRLAHSPEFEACVVSTRSPILVVRSVFQDGHWHARLEPTQASLDDRVNGGSTVPETRSLPVFSVDRLKQGIVVPPGDWRVEFSYAPWWLSPSIAGATIGWFGLVGGVLYRSRIKRDGTSDETLVN